MPGASPAVGASFSQQDSPRNLVLSMLGEDMRALPHTEVLFLGLFLTAGLCSLEIIPNPLLRLFYSVEDHPET